MAAAIGHIGSPTAALIPRPLTLATAQAYLRPMPTATRRLSLVSRACLLVLVALPVGTGPQPAEARGFTHDAVPALVEHYGDDALQIGELRLPPRGKGPFPVAVIFHGGCWTREGGSLRDTAALAEDLTRHGVATWNVSYRRIGDEGGGWPGTFTDWASATDHLRSLAERYPIDLRRVMTVGHGSGATAALWTAARGKLPAASPIRGADPMKVASTVALDGPVDLVDFRGRDVANCGGDVVGMLLGGAPAEVPERYAQASPRALLPLGIPQAVVSSSMLDVDRAIAYRNAGRAAGDDVTLSALSAGNSTLVLMRPGPGDGRSAGYLTEDLILHLVPPKTGQFRYLP